MTIWDVLGIYPTNDVKEIKKAYARRLKEYHPEENQEEFLLLQEAYQNAIRQAKMASDMYETNDSLESGRRALFREHGKEEAKEQTEEDPDDMLPDFESILGSATAEGNEEEIAEVMRRLNDAQDMDEAIAILEENDILVLLYDPQFCSELYRWMISRYFNRKQLKKLKEAVQVWRTEMNLTHEEFLKIHEELLDQLQEKGHIPWFGLGAFTIFLIVFLFLCRVSIIVILLSEFLL